MDVKEKTIRTDTGIWIRCPNRICGHYQWLYKGRFFIYATCPSCKHNVLISKNRIERPLRSVELQRQKQIEVANVGGATAQS